MNAFKEATSNELMNFIKVDLSGIYSELILQPNSKVFDAKCRTIIEEVQDAGSEIVLHGSNGSILYITKDGVQEILINKDIKEADIETKIARILIKKAKVQ